VGAQAKKMRLRLDRVSVISADGRVFRRDRILVAPWRMNGFRIGFSRGWGGEGGGVRVGRNARTKGKME